MNCFDWQNRCSDYLDGTLIGSIKKEADEHLDYCPHCRERHKHYRAILQAISNQPRSPLPISLRKAPFSLALPRQYFRNRRNQWGKAPWYVRTGVEGVGIAIVILFVVAMVPRARLLYERGIERRLDLFTSENLTKTDDVPLTRGKNAPADNPASDTAEEFQGEFASEEDDEIESQADEKAGNEVRVGNSQIWRFMLKTDSPREVRPKIVQLLSEVGIPKQTPGLGGIEAPGGIQFDLIVPQSAVPRLKTLLQKLAGPSSPSEEKNQYNPNEAFTWYKSRSKRPIPSGKSRVFIWLSQM